MQVVYSTHRNAVSFNIAAANYIMTDISSTGGHLETPYVFLDSQALRREKFDWNGKHLGRLRELVKSGDVRILTTSITKREVRALISELLDEARKAVAKSRAVLNQLGHEDAVSDVDARDAADALEVAFEKFYSDVNAFEVPISISVNELFDAYFKGQAPFSSKKKSEFPDAAVVASLTKWCAENNVTAYVVSADSDMKASCAIYSDLVSVDTISDILTRAAVSQEFLLLLTSTLSESAYLTDELAAQVLESDVVPARRHHLGCEFSVAGKVERIDEINILNVDVVERDGGNIVCEVSFEAEAVVAIRAEVEGLYGYGPDDYAPFQEWQGTRGLIRLFHAEVIVSDFDPQEPDKLQFLSVYIAGQPVELLPEDVMPY